jgi:Helix-turn-helix domain
VTARSGNETGHRGSGAEQQRREAATNLQPAPQLSGTGGITVMGRELGKQLASLRQAAGLTQHKLGTLTGYARGTISAVEAGRFDQSRDFWQHCDDALRAGGRLVSRYDKIKADVAAIQYQQGLARQAAGAAAWRQACGDGEPPLPGGPAPPAFPSSTAGTDIHIWFTTSEGITHWLTIPRASASPELLVQTLGRMLGMDQQ